MTAQVQFANPATPDNSTASIPAASAALARGEDTAAYDDLAARVARAVAPAGVVEQLLVREVVDVTWDVARLRRYKVDLLATRAADGMEAVLRGLGETSARGKARAWAAGTPTAIADVNEQLATAGLGPDAVAASTFVAHLDEYERIEKMIGAAEARRAAILREIGRHRAALAARLREATDRAAMIEDGELAEVAPAAGAAA
jgi:hypothetical protein